MSFPTIGNKAPAFTLLNQDGEKIRLSDFAGEKHVVVYFYPKALTPGCTTQACGIRDLQTEFVENDIVVLGLSPDPVAKLKKFEDKHEVISTLMLFKICTIVSFSLMCKFNVDPDKFRASQSNH